jgi:predicted Mrr-cat superfamily restriction endonuclease
VFEQPGVIAVGLAGIDEDVSAGAREQLVERVVAALDEPRERAQGYASMLDRLVYEMQLGDVVVTPETPNGEVMVGEVASPYEGLRRPPAPGFEHARRVNWIRAYPARRGARL